MLILIKYLFLSLINFAFNTTYSLTESVTFLDRKIVRDTKNGFKISEVDVLFKVGRGSKLYHLEFQTLDDKRMPDRISDYDVDIKNNPDLRRLKVEHCLIQLKYKAGKISFVIDGDTKHVIVLNVSDLSLQKIISNNLQILAPFYFYRYEEKILKGKQLTDIIRTEIKRDLVRYMAP